MPQEWHPDVEAKMAEIDALLARNRAIVASWGYVEVPLTKEEREAEYKELEQRGPPYLGLGCPIPQDWIDEEESEERKWRSGSLRKNMGLQASKPRNANDKSTNAAAHANDDSSDEEEGRTGLGRARNTRNGGGRGDEGEAKSNEVRDAMKTYARATSLQEILANASKESNSEKVESWKQKTAGASIQSPILPAPESASRSPVFVQKPSVEKFKKRKQSDYSSSSDEKLTSKSKAMKVDGFMLRGDQKGKPERSSFSEAKQAATQASKSSALRGLSTTPSVSKEMVSKYPSNNARLLEKFPEQGLELGKSGGQWVEKTKKDRGTKKNGGFVPIAKTESIPEFEIRTRDMIVGNEEDLKAGTPMQANAETMAQMRQLARERLGSGSYSKNTRRAKTKGSLPAPASYADKKKLKKNGLLKADFT